MKPPAVRGGKYTLAAVAVLLASLFSVRLPFKDGGDPDAGRNVSEVIADKGYPVEEHEVTTRDDYVLSLQRIPRGREQNATAHAQRATARRTPVLIEHALFFSSFDWVLNRPDQSLPYILADAGFDVWLGNTRGNTLSRHLRYTRSEKEFWDYSFQEITEYDLPDTIDFVLNKTGQSKLFYIGHSIGAGALFGLLSEKPHYNEKILLFSAMAPAVKYRNMKSGIRHLFTPIEQIAALAGLFGRYDFMSRGGMVSFLGNYVCRSWAIKPVCRMVINGICGPPSHEINETRLEVFLSHTPAGTSYKNMIHIGQVLKTGRFRKFDFGVQRNLAVYGQESPPDYDLRQVSAPVALFWSEADALVPAEDVASLRKEIPNLVLDFRVADVRFSHQEFAIGVTAKEALYDALVEALIRFSPQEAN